MNMLLIYLSDFRIAVVVEQYAVVAVALFAHHGSTYLAEPHAVSPSGTCEDKPLWNALLHHVLIHYEGTAIEVGSAQCTPDFQFFADDKCSLGAHDFQFPYSSAFSTGYGNEVENVSQVNFHVFADELFQLILGIFHFPPEEVGCFLVVVVEHLR